MTLKEHGARESLNDDQLRNLLRFAQEIRRQIECPLHSHLSEHNPKDPHLIEEPLAMQGPS
jgi:hypothetical protein